MADELYIIEWRIIYFFPEYQWFVSVYLYSTNAGISGQSYYPGPTYVDEWVLKMFFQKVLAFYDVNMLTFSFNFRVLTCSVTLFIWTLVPKFFVDQL